jgi:hypothetical protein
MRSWQIIVASVAAASFAVGIAFLPDVLQFRTDPASLFLVYWPAFAILWLGAYAIATLLLSTVATLREIGSIAAGLVGQGWARRHLVRLEVTQCFTAVLALFALGLSPVAIETEPFFSLPTMIGLFPALAACGGVVVAGVLGWLMLSVMAAFRGPPVLMTGIPAIRDERLLHEIIELLRARLPEPTADAIQLSELVEQGHRSMLGTIKDLTTAVDRLRNGVADIKTALQDPRTGHSSDNSAAPSDIADAASELHAAAAALTAAVTRLDDLAAALSSNETAAAQQSNVPTGSRSQLTTELQELLREMTSGAARRIPSG